MEQTISPGADFAEHHGRVSSRETKPPPSQFRMTRNLVCSLAVDILRCAQRHTANMLNKTQQNLQVLNISDSYQFQLFFIITQSWQYVAFSVQIK